MKTIMVQLSNEHWTLEAMHLASAMTRSLKGKVVLLRLVLANNPGLLGWGIPLPTSKEEHQIRNYATVAEDYGVEFSVQPMQYVSLVEALAQAVEGLKVDVLFANVAKSKIPLWGVYQQWSLKRKLHGCQLVTLDEKESLQADKPVTPAAVWDHR
jgi:hypothetical protein